MNKWNFFDYFLSNVKTQGGVNMKKNLWIGFIVLSLILSTIFIGEKYLPKGGNALAENVNMNHTVSVSGEGIVETTPDIAIINFGIIFQKKTATDAMNELTDIANKTITALKKAGVEDKNIKTTNINLKPVYQWSKEKNTSVLIGYSASEMFELKTKIKDAGTMIGLLNENGVNNISSIRFDVSDKGTLEQDAIAQAMKNAKTKAEASLKDSNYKIVGIKTISINSNNPTPIYRNSMSPIPTVGEKVSMPVEGGAMSIKAQVQVIFIFD